MTRIAVPSKRADHSRECAAWDDMGAECTCGYDKRSAPCPHAETINGKVWGCLYSLIDHPTTYDSYIGGQHIAAVPSHYMRRVYFV